MDTEKKCVQLYDVEDPKTFMTWHPDDLRAERLKIEKSTDDSCSLSIVNFKEKGEKTLDILFGSNLEREVFFMTTFQFQQLSGMQTLKVFTGTWNMGSAQPPSLHAWISTDLVYDIYAIAVQVNRQALRLLIDVMFFFNRNSDGKKDKKKKKIGPNFCKHKWEENIKIMSFYQKLACGKSLWSY